MSCYMVWALKAKKPPARYMPIHVQTCLQQASRCLSLSPFLPCCSVARNLSNPRAVSVCSFKPLFFFLECLIMTLLHEGVLMLIFPKRMSLAARACSRGYKGEGTGT